jgi:hypothetical protein
MEVPENGRGALFSNQDLVFESMPEPMQCLLCDLAGFNFAENPGVMSTRRYFVQYIES